MSETIEKRNDRLMILTVREVAKYLRMSETKIYRLVKQRHLPAIRIGKSWRFRKDLLDDWLNQCTEASIQDMKTATIVEPVAIKADKGDPQR
jgi:excisionase family DNA binding protein